MELSVKCASGFDQWSDHRSTSSCLEYSFVFFLSVFLSMYLCTCTYVHSTIYMKMAGQQPLPVLS
jgi:hypothetical protein